jgi:flagellar assembly protein FliH
MIFQSETGVFKEGSLTGVLSDLMTRGERPVSRIDFASIDEPEPEPEPVIEEVLVEEDPLQKQAEAHARELREQVSIARSEAALEARQLFDLELERRLLEERQRFDRVRVEFARDRQRFFAAAEGQVVRLSLAIARKILAREVESDGLHLRSTVKAALGRVQDGSATVLRVSEHETEAWSVMFQRETFGNVEVVGDARLAPGDCVLETSLGRVDLGVEAQMKEVERGFDALMQEQGQ